MSNSVDVQLRIRTECSAKLPRHKCVQRCSCFAVRIYQWVTWSWGGSSREQQNVNANIADTIPPADGNFFGTPPTNPVTHSGIASLSLPTQNPNQNHILYCYWSNSLLACQVLVLQIPTFGSLSMVSDTFLKYLTFVIKLNKLKAEVPRGRVFHLNLFEHQSNRDHDIVLSQDTRALICLRIP